MMHKYDILFEALGYRFEDIKLLEEAFTHNSMGRKRRTYQRLEFLGDRVLGLVVAEMLFKSFPREKEGDLAKRHAALVKEETLAKVAREIDLSSYLILSESERPNSNNPTLLADSCEALIGAVYIEAGFAKARDFVIKYWVGRMEKQAEPPIDNKSALQEWAQGKGYSLPEYTVVETRGVDHDPEFVMEARIQRLSQVGIGVGRSKKVAEQVAAADLLGKLKADG